MKYPEAWVKSPKITSKYDDLNANKFTPSQKDISNFSPNTFPDIFNMLNYPAFQIILPEISEINYSL